MQIFMEEASIQNCIWNYQQYKFVLLRRSHRFKELYNFRTQFFKPNSQKFELGYNQIANQSLNYQNCRASTQQKGRNFKRFVEIQVFKYTNEFNSLESRQNSTNKNIWNSVGYYLVFIIRKQGLWRRYAVNSYLIFSQSLRIDQTLNLTTFYGSFKIGKSYKFIKIKDFKYYTMKYQYCSSITRYIQPLIVYRKQYNFSLVLKYMNIKTTYICLLIIATITSQQLLPLNSKTKVQLTNNQTQTFTIALPHNISDQSDLFIDATSLINNPNQVPKLVMTNKDGFTAACYQQSNQFEGICSIDHANLTQSNKQWNIQVSCLQQCTFWLQAYLNDVYTLQLGHHIKIAPKDNTKNIFQFQMMIPTQQQFDSIIIQVQIKQLGNLTRGVQLYINIGNATTVMPGPDNFKYKAIPTHRGIGVAMTSSDFSLGSVVKMTLYTSTDSQLKLKSHVQKGNQLSVGLGQTKYMFTPKNSESIFVMDLRTYLSDIASLDINIVVLLFSGYPQVDISFTSTFTNKLITYGLGSNLDYLLTPQIRSQYNFTGVIYIRVKSLSDECYYEIKSAVNSKEYVYIEQSVTYVSFVPTEIIQNYIYDYKYQIAKNQSSSKILYFTIKLQMIEGSAYFACRLCSQLVNKKCTVSTKAQLLDSKFQKQVDDLPGNILQYYSLYQIFLYNPVSQCIKLQEQPTSNYDSYLCKIHIVGTSIQTKKDFGWGITTYSRQSSIQLQQGSNFKDMVYQDNYNYYKFSLPSYDNITDITIFATVLSGQIQLISSLTSINPQKLFMLIQGNDIRSSVNNKIVYNASDVNGSIYIGVYGVSVGDYIIHVLVGRVREKGVARTAVGLMERIGQLFQMGREEEEMGFEMKMGKQGIWMLQIVELIGSVQVNVVNKNRQQNVSVCSSNKCEIIINKSQQFLMTLRNSKGISCKFIINYYPKEACRLLPFGIPNFIQIQANSSQCLSFIIKEDDIQIAVSQNIINSLTSSSNIKLSLNDQDLGQMKGHYQSFTSSSIKQHCATSNSTMKKGCILKLIISGDSTYLTELQVAVLTPSNQNPLFDGISLLSQHKQLTQSNPALFYYELTSLNTLTLIVKSLTYHQYFIAYSWVDSLNFINTTQPRKLYPVFPSQSANVNRFQLNAYHRRISASIATDDLKCQQCMLLVAIYPTQLTKFNLFQIQVIGCEIILGLGQTKRGSISRDEVYVFELGQNKYSNASILTFKHRNSCFIAQLYQANSQKEQITIQGDEFIIASNQVQLQLTLTGNSQVPCQFQITYWSLQSPMRTIQSGLSYHINLKNNSQNYLLYYHQSNVSFRIYQIIKSGYVSSFATPIINRTLQQIIKQNSYIFGGKSIYDDLQVKTDSASFCSECYYLIKLIGSPSVEGRVGVTELWTAVVMNEEGVIRQKIKAQQTRKYQYYSSQFIVKVSVVYGSISLQIKDQLGSQLFQQLIQNDKEISINITEGLPSKAMAVISVTAASQATFSLQIKTAGVSRLIQGYPLTYHFKQSAPAVFVYSHVGVQDINLLAVVDDRQTVLSGSAVLKASLSTKTASGVQTKNVVIISNETAGNILSFDLTGIEGQYTIVITFKINITVKIIITRNKLIYLQPNVPTISKRNAIFQIYTASHPVLIEIFSCFGEIEVTASSQYSKINNVSSAQTIALDHSNVGGHFIIQSQSGQNQYYTQVRSKKDQKEPSQYKLVYSYIIDQPPYDYFSSIDRSIQYKMSTDSILLYFYVPALKNQDNDLAAVTALYQVYAASSEAEAKSYGQCSIGHLMTFPTKQVKPFPLVDDQKNEFVILKKDLQSIKTTIDDTVFINLVLTISFKQKGVKRSLTYIYQPLQISYFNNLQISKAKENTSLISWIMVWIVLPIILGITLLVLALKYCLHRFKQLFKIDSMLVEQEQSNAPSIQILNNKQVKQHE